MDNRKVQDINPRTAQEYDYPQLTYAQEDEVNLIDLWRVLAKRKGLVLAIGLFVTLVGSAFALLKHDTYNYSTVIEVGSLFVNGAQKPVDDAKGVASKVKEVYINTAISDFLRNNPDQDKNFRIEASVPKDSQMVLISSKSTEQAAPAYIKLINTISDKVVGDLNIQIKKFKDRMADQISETQKHLENLKQQATGLDNRIAAFEKGFKVTPLENGGTTILVLNGLVAQQQQIGEERARLESQLSNSLLDLNLTEDTKTLFPVTRSLEPIGVGKTLIVAMSILLGLVMGILAALIWDQIEKMNTRLDAN